MRILIACEDCGLVSKPHDPRYCSVCGEEDKEAFKRPTYGPCI